MQWPQWPVKLRKQKTTQKSNNSDSLGLLQSLRVFNFELSEEFYISQLLHTLNEEVINKNFNKRKEKK